MVEFFNFVRLGFGSFTSRFFCDELIFSSRCDLCCFREFSLGGFLLLFEFWREKPLVLDFSLFESTFFGPVLQNCISFHFRIKRFESSSSSLIQMSNGVSVVAFFAFLVGGFPEVEPPGLSTRRSDVQTHNRRVLLVSCGSLLPLCC